MIKRISTLLLLLLLSINLMSQGWRKGEMEVWVQSGHGADIQKIRALGLDFEPAGTDGNSLRMYLIPAELKLLQNSRIPYRITIPDMNEHYAHFWDNPLVPSGYYTYEQIIAIADSLETNFPAICKKVSWGTSLGGRQLVALKISDNVNADEPEAEIMFDGGIHGDEVGGSQNLIMFARDLCLGYGHDPQITELVDTREIWLYLMVNPDGRVSMSRYNNNGVDCNRDNGYMWNGEGNSWGAFSQVETKALRNAVLDNQFVVYTNYHSGTEVIAYPWSYRTEASRDNAHINQLAGVYSATSGYSSLQYGQGYNIMYAINGSTKDFLYGCLGNVGWSIEISNDKQPPSSQIGYYYNANKPSMIEMIKRCGWGVTGMVTDSLTGEPVAASVWVSNYFPVYTDPVVGDYHKYLLPGSYTMRVMANGYQTRTIVNVAVPGQGAVVADVKLVPAVNHFAFKVTGCQIPGNNFGDEGYTPGALGQPDGVPYSLGRNGWIILDMHDTIYNGPGMDFRVIQAGTTNKSFTVSGGNNLDGPFTAIGTGNGTTSFDLGTSSLNKVRYLYIKDNGSGAASGPGAGFNLDAVEMITIPLIVNFIASPQLTCTGSYVTFTDISSGNPTSWHWSFPGGTPSSSTLQNPGPVRYDNPGIFDVSLTVSNGITSGTKTRTGCITVNPAPEVSLGKDTSICAWTSLVLDAGNPGMNYHWSTGATTQSINADSTGTGYGTTNYGVTVSSANGCSASDTIRITFENCTGTVEASVTNDITVFPNPSDGRFVLGVRGFAGGSWQLSSTAGFMMARSEITGTEYRTEVDVHGLSPGIYFLIVRKEAVVMVKKIMITGSE